MTAAKPLKFRWPEANQWLDALAKSLNADRALTDEERFEIFLVAAARAVTADKNGLSRVSERKIASTVAALRPQILELVAALEGGG